MRIIESEKPKRVADYYERRLQRGVERCTAHIRKNNVELAGVASDVFSKEFECWKIDQWPEIEQLQAALKGSPSGAAPIRFEY